MDAILIFKQICFSFTSQYVCQTLQTVHKKQEEVLLGVTTTLLLLLLTSIFLSLQ